MSKSKVTFSMSTEDGKVTEKCQSCNFRSISPRTRDFYVCPYCKIYACHHCVLVLKTKNPICFDCHEDLLSFKFFTKKKDDTDETS